MGEVELDPEQGRISIHSVIVCYGGAANAELAQQIANDIASSWNSPEGTLHLRRQDWQLQFSIDAQYEATLDPAIVWYNENPLLNFFRIEGYAEGNISFVDGIGSNTGYFKLDNLFAPSTTAAHEYGHTLGLQHPHQLDIRGRGQPGIMYPRGTVCDPLYQYDPHAKPLAPGGTLHPAKRKVLLTDWQNLKLERLQYRDNKGILGEFSNLYHARHEA